MSIILTVYYTSCSNIVCIYVKLLKQQNQKFLLWFYNIIYNMILWTYATRAAGQSAFIRWHGLYVWWWCTDKDCVDSRTLHPAIIMPNCKTLESNSSMNVPWEMQVTTGRSLSLPRCPGIDASSREQTVPRTMCRALRWKHRRDAFTTRDQPRVFGFRDVPETCFAESSWGQLSEVFQGHVGAQVWSELYSMLHYQHVKLEDLFSFYW